MAVNSESESNNTQATANAVTLGAAITGQLATKTDVDYYKVTATSAGTLSVVFDVPTSSSYTDYFSLGLYNSAGTQLSTFTTGADKTYTMGAPAAGTYYIGIASTNYYHDSGQYKITVSNAAGSANAYESESNNTQGTANAVTLGAAITGQLATKTDVDYYKVTATSAGTLSVVFDVPTSSSYTDYFSLGLYNSAGTQLSTFTTGADKTYTMGAPAAGTYYIGIASTNYYHDSGQYKITVSNAAGSANAYESESNNTQGTANAVTLGAAITGQLATKTDVDYYKVTATSAGTLSVVFDVPTSSSYTDYFSLGLYNSAGTQLSTFTTGADKTYTMGAPAAGTYYIGIASTNYYHDSGQYKITVSNAAGSANAYESESNNTQGTANAVTLGAAITGQLATKTDVDYYKVTATSAGTLSVVFDVPTSSSYTDYFSLGLYNSAGTQLSTFTTGADKTYTMGAPAAGTYYIGIASTNYYHDSGQYKITVSNAAGSANAYESESNNTQGTANAVTLGAAITGQLATKTDVDYYKVTATSAGTLSVVFDVPTSSSYTDYFSLGLYNSAGTQLSTFTTGADKTYTMGAPAAGTYYIGIASTNYYHDSGQYKITVSNAAGSANAYESESNNTQGTANAVTLGAAITGQLATKTDVDYYKVTATSAGTLSVVFDVPTSSSYTDYFSLGLYNSAGTQLSTFTTGADKTYTMGAPAAGTYYIGIASTNYYHDSGQYKITVSNAAGSANAYESESNNTQGTANALSVNTPMSGQLASTADTDYFKLQLAQAGVISVTFDAPTNSTYTDYFRVSVVDASGNVIASQETGQDIAFQAAVGTAGSYYINVDSTNYYHDSGQYKITASTSNGTSGYELEPNDNYANVISSGAAIRGQVAASTDIDWFVLDVSQPGALSLYFDAPTNSSYTDYFHVWLLDSDGNLLASQATGQDITLNASAPEAGSYFVAITAGDFYHDTRQYALTVTNTASTLLYESETNNTSAQADALPLGGQIRGQLSSSVDQDRFAVTLNSGGTLTATFDSPTNSTWSDYFQIAIYDQSGNRLSYRSIGSDLAFDTDVAVSGTYYVSVTAGAYYYSAGEYKLTVNAQLNDPVPVGAITGTTLGDILVGTTGDDRIYGLGGNDQINGGTGVDTVVFRSAKAHLSINTIEGLTTVRGNYAAGEHAYSTTRLWNVEKIQTYEGTQTLSATTINPILGTLQNDVLSGTSGDDILDGLGGSDYINGGAGSDTLLLFGAKEKFTTLTVSGITRIEAAEDANEYASQTIKTINVERIAFTQSQTKDLATTSATVVFGTTGANSMVGSSADEVFDGQGGSDTIDGGAGSDTVVFFGRADNFTITFPTGAQPTVTVVGKTGSEYAGQTVTASNIESLAFSDRTVSVTNPPKVVLTSSTTVLAEGGVGATLELSLSVAPVSTVTINVVGGTQLAASVQSLTFDASNWATPQTLTVTAIDDTALEGTHSGTLTVTVQTSDSLYKDVGSSTLGYSVSDNGNDLATTGGVSGKLWNDFDKDGVYDAGEARLIGWTVFDDVNKNGKRDSGEAQATTDANGNYLLGNLSPGSHTIMATTPSGWLPTVPGQGTASATIITNTTSSGTVTIGAFTETVVSSAVAQATYNNLGTATNIAAFHADSRFTNINGQGYSVVVIDSGADLNHSYFGPDSNNDGVADRIVFQYDFFGQNDNNASDGDGHGTHVAGIIGSSNGTYPGIAPEVNLIVLKVFSDTGVGDDGTALREAANWVVANADKYNVVAVNLSLGFGNFHTTPIAGFLSSQFQSLANQGVVVVSASGNSYADEYDNNPNTTGTARPGVSYPSSDPYSLSVGAVWASNGSYGSLQTGTTDAVAFFSQRDDTESDVFAPGVWIDSSWNDGSHRAISGTSMASPEIAGMVALAQQLAVQELGRRLSFDEIRSLFKSTGDPIVDGDNENDIVPNTNLTFYRADMLSLAEAILGLKPPASHAVTVTAGTTVTDKDFGFAATTSVQALSGDDLVYGTSYGEELRGGAGSDQINGGAGDDQIYGEGGDDNLNGGDGVDILIGGLGNDTYVVDSTTDTITEAAGAGTDSVNSSVTYTLGNNLENLTLTGSVGLAGTGNALNNSITGTSGNDTLNGGAGIDTLIGGLGNDTYVVDSTTDTITEAAGAGTDSVNSSVTYTLGNNLENLTLTGSVGLAGTGNALNNSITGTSGNDTLNGGAGIDTLIGGLGNDTYVVDSTTDTITEAAGAGTDSVNSSVTYTLGNNLENLTLTGSVGLAGTGNALNNSITGTSGNDTLNGGAGIDTLIGGLGNDTYVVDSTTDTITEAAGAGTDSVNSSVTYTLGNNLENLTLTGSVGLAGTGNALNNSITGTSGNDTLNGGAGIDTLIGGLGNDTYVVDSTTDTITEAAGAGTDSVNSSVTYTLGNNLENLTLTGSVGLAGTGNALNNSITGTSGNDTLNGGAGIDTLIGGLGNDTYVVDSTTDTITEAAGAGTDSVNSSVTYTLGNNLENLTLTGSVGLAGTGNALNNSITGTSGNDTLNGGAGIDTLIGGLGNDTYVVDSTTDTITEAAGAGTDSVNSSVTYTLGNNLENLTLTGSVGLAGTGNALNNSITGTSGNDTLNGGAGIDTLIGGLGNDTYVVDSTTDTITEAAGAGTDSVNSSVTYTLGNNLENLTLTGSVGLAGTGNALNNSITGTSGNDTLNGGAGIDTLIGGLGNDTYVVDSTTDTITELANAGTDTVQSSVTYTLGTNLENLTLTGSTAINGTGNALDNTITGNGAANTLNGSSGNDTLDGGIGAVVDIIDGGDGVDTVSYASLTSSLSTGVTLNLGGTKDSNGYVSASGLGGADKVKGVENILGSAYADVFTGDSAANTLNGGAGNDSLNGGAGNDTLIGGLGNDTLSGGIGYDVFVFNSATTNNLDTILDFATGTDKIQLSKSIFANLGSTGNLTENAYWSAAGAVKGNDANDRVVYNTTTGALYYDADGSGSGAAVQIALLGTSSHPAMAFTDFVLMA